MARRSRSRSPPRYVSPQVSAGGSNRLAQDNSTNYRGLEYDNYTSYSRYRSPRRTYTSPSYSFTRQMGAMSLDGPASSGRSAAKSSPTRNVTLLSEEGPESVRPRRLTSRSRSAPRVSSREGYSVQPPDNRSFTPGFEDSYGAAALQGDNTQSTRSRLKKERLENRRAAVVTLQQRLTQYGGMAGYLRHLHEPLYNPRSRTDTAESRFYTVEEQERRNVDDAAGLNTGGRSIVPFPYPRQDPYEAYRYSNGPDYGDRPFSPRRPRRRYNWIDEPWTDDIQASDATGHYSEDRGSLYGLDLSGGRGDFQGFRHHPHFPTYAQDQRYGIGGNRWAEPNPNGLGKPVVQDVMDQNF